MGDRVSSEVRGFLRSINVSNGGVPKLPRTSCYIRTCGLDGDTQSDLRYHGGPDRAVSLYSFDLIQSLQAEGHPIAVGSTGENLTLAGVDWHAMTSGVEVQIGAVVLVLSEPADPCKKIAESFRGHSFSRISRRTHPGWSRMYARVLQEGVVVVGDPVTWNSAKVSS
jgi:MOSC domain-containing protein YiiM